MSILSKSIYTFNVILNQSVAAFKELTQIIYKILWPRIVKTILKMKHKVREVILLDSDFPQSYNHQIAQWWLKNRLHTHRSVKQTESPQINPYYYGQLILPLTCQGFSMRDRKSPNKHCDNLIPVQKTMNLGPYLTLYPQINRHMVV